MSIPRVSPVAADLVAMIDDSISRTSDQISTLERSFNGIVEAAELTSTDDEHDPEGATIAYERAQVWALLQQWREDLAALHTARDRATTGRGATCSTCAGEIAPERLVALPGVATCIGCARWQGEAMNGNPG